MCTTAARANRFRAIAVQASTLRYRRYAEAKRRIPMDLPPSEYEKEVKRLARKYKV